MLQKALPPGSSQACEGRCCRVWLDGDYGSLDVAEKGQEDGERLARPPVG